MYMAALSPLATGAVAVSLGWTVIIIGMAIIGVVMWESYNTGVSGDEIEDLARLGIVPHANIDSMRGGLLENGSLDLVSNIPGQ